MADETEPPAPSAESSELPAPDAADITEAFERVRRQEVEREKELQEPRFVAEREASQTEYADSTPAEVEELFRANFGEALAQMNLDPARYLSDAKLDRPLGESAGVVTKEGQTSLMEGPIPVEAENEAGELEKVDLTLERSTEGFEPENPIVETTIGAVAEEGVELGGEEGLEVSQAGADESSGRAFGDKNILFPEVSEGSETDLLVSPTASGVELSDLLRSVDSPETLRFHLALPTGAILHVVAGGAAEVEGSDGSTLALIQKPSGVDAQGTYVPVAMEVEGDSIILQTNHRQEDLAYPILIDPEVVYEDWQHPNWYENQRLAALSYWHWASNYGSIIHPSEDVQWPGHHGLFIATPNGTLPGGIYGENYVYRNLGSYLTKAYVNIFWRQNQSCSAPNPYSQPYDFDGLYDASQGRWNDEHINDANKYGASDFADGSWGHEFVEGMATSYETYIPCWRDTMVGGMELWWGDWGGPELTTVSGMPSGWTKMNSQQRTITVAAHSGGLGVQKIRLFGVGGREYAWNQPWCSGTLEDACSENRGGTISYETSGAASYEGEQTFTVQALDPDQHGEHSNQYPLKLDGLPPSISMSGQLANATAPEGVDKLSLPVYNLTVKAKDLLSTGGAGSGVRRIKVFVDNTEVEGSGPTCTSSSCPTEYENTYQVPLTGLTENEHNVEVRAVDFVGNETPLKTWLKNFEFIPATGMKEEYVLQHFVLPDGKNHEGEEYEGPELAVNVMNGNVVYHERDLQVSGGGGRNVELERIYNSQQPTARDGQWGHGWSLTQTPEFKPESSEPTSGKMLRTSAVTSAVNLPKSTGETAFSSRLHATVAKTAGGSYEVRSATEDQTQVFNSSGQIEETRLSNVSPEVTVAPEPIFPLYAESFGTSGAGSGQFGRPADVDRDYKGNFWVVDRGNNRIEKFNEAGEFIREAGGLGTGAGKLNTPSGIAIEASGNVWIADTGNNRVVEFSEGGTFLEAFGFNVNKTKVEAGGSASEKNLCTAASGNTCQAGTAGSAPGQLSAPLGIAAPSTGGVWVVDTGNSRLEKFNKETGANTAVVSAEGTEPGQLKSPTAIVFRSDGWFWVADTGNNRIEQWNAGFGFVRAVGKEGSGHAEFKNPAALDIGPEGNLYVGDQGNQRVQELDRVGGYITQFGSSGQFEFSTPMGMSLDSAGELLVTDSGRNQVQEWMTGSFLFKGSRIGSNGTGQGQFSHPADLALDGKGNLWALDRGNNRLEKFNEAGEFIVAVGTKGGAAGQLNAPSALAIDPSGNLWVADTANNRIEEFNEAGQFVLVIGREVNKTKTEAAGATEAEKNVCTAASGNACQAGIAGGANGQLKAPQGIATTSAGSLWVADTGNNRMQKFGPTGNNVAVITGSNSAAGSMKEPAAIAMGPDGSIWVADSGNNRIEQWSSSLSLTRYFGSEGSGNGQFVDPATLDVDSSGNVWVGDQGNDRVQQFTSSGGYVAQLGSASQFAFSAPMGVAADNKGGLWVTDTDHSRVQRILTSEFETPVATQVPVIDYTYSGTALTKMELKEPEATGPSITIANSSGLATSATSGAVAATYSYASGNLTAKKSSEGEAKYERDELTNRITKVTLPNGTWAKVTYDNIGRATKVIVKPAGGVEKTTNFKYELSPRKTIVWGTEKPEVIYYIGEDGSVLKIESAATPPILYEPKGSLWGHRNDPNPIENKDQTLFVTAESQNEIASIRIISGNSVLAEETCEDNSAPPKLNCVRPPQLEWITNPSEHAAGRLDLEVVATDFQGRSTSERFFVTIPDLPPPNPEQPEKPEFSSVKQFREEYGLDRGSPLTQPEMNKLILELLYEWEAQLPTAMTSVEEWGIPMRAPELSEMNFRREYLAQASEAIPQWSEEHAESTYGGYYVDNRAGGVIYVGFTQNQGTTVEALKSSGALMAPDKVVPMPTPPVNSLLGVEATESQVASAIAGSPSIDALVETISVNFETDKVEVTTSNISQVREFLEGIFGNAAPIEVRQNSDPIETSALSRFGVSGPMLAGAGIQSDTFCEGGRCGLINQCTAAFGAEAEVGQLFNGPIWGYFKLTAGHCFPEGARTFRRASRASGPTAPVGEIRRDGYYKVNGENMSTDGEAALVEKQLATSNVFVGNPDVPLMIDGMERARVHRLYCWSGFKGGVQCGMAFHRLRFKDENGRRLVGMYVNGPTVQGDSGGPVWDPRTQKAVGLISAHSRNGRTPCHELPTRGNWCPWTIFQPLLPFYGKSYPDGAMPTLGLQFRKGE